MSGFANEAYIVVTLNLLSLELKCNNPGKRTVAFESLCSVTVRFAVAVRATSSWGSAPSPGRSARFSRPSSSDGS